MLIFHKHDDIWWQLESGQLQQRNSLTAIVYKTLLAAIVFNILAAQHNEVAADLHSKGNY